MTDPVRTTYLIEILQDEEVITEGKKVGPSEAALLQKLKKFLHEELGDTVVEVYESP